MVWAGKDLKDHLAPTSAMGRDLPLDQVAQNVCVYIYLYLKYNARLVVGITSSLSYQPEQESYPSSVPSSAEVAQFPHL